MDFLTIFLIVFCVFFVVAVLQAIRVRRARAAARARMYNASGDPGVVIIQQPGRNYAYEPYQGAGYTDRYQGHPYNQNGYSPPYPGNGAPSGYSQPYYYPPNNNP